MKFEIYCDEANPDILTSRHPRARHLMIGSLWVPVELRTEIKARISALRLRHKAWGGWDKMAHGYDSSRRVAVVYEAFMVVLAMGLKQNGMLKANFVTCYQADNSIGKIRTSPVWPMPSLAGR